MIPLTFIQIDIAEQVHAAWKKAEYSPPIKAHGFPSATELSPTAEEWAHILNLALGASLQKDEARSTTFRIAFERNVTESFFGTLGFPEEIRLEEMLDATVEELVKLAHAATDASVVWIRRVVGTGRYLITGIGPAWSVRPAVDPDVTLNGPPTSVPIVHVLGPGELRILKGIVPVAWLTGCELHTSPRGDVLRPLLADRCGAFIDKMVARFLERFRATGSRSEDLRDYMQFRAARIVERVVLRARAEIMEVGQCRMEIGVANPLFLRACSGSWTRFGRSSRCCARSWTSA